MPNTLKEYSRRTSEVSNAFTEIVTQFIIPLEEGLQQSNLKEKNIKQMKALISKRKSILEEFDKLALTKDQLEFLKVYKDGLRKRDTTEKNLLDNILTNDQLNRLNHIKHELNKLNNHHKKITASQIINPVDIENSITRVSKESYKFFPGTFSFLKLRFTNKYRPKIKLDLEQRKKVKRIRKEMLNLEVPQNEIKKLCNIKSRRNYKNNEKRFNKVTKELNLTNDQRSKLLVITNLLNELKFSKDQIVRSHLSCTRINRIDFFLKEIFKFIRKDVPRPDLVDPLEFTKLKSNQGCTSNHLTEKQINPNYIITGTRIRQAQVSDIPQIERLCTEQTEALFGTVNLQELLETSTRSLVAEDESCKITVFMAVSDFPHIPFIPKHGWELWITNLYLTTEFTPPSTRFLQCLVWDEEKLNASTLQVMIQNIFRHDPFVKFILVIMPWGQQIYFPYNLVFLHYLSGRDMSQELRSVKKARLGLEPYLLPLYVVDRYRFGPTIRIRCTHEIYNEEVAENLAIMAPPILEVYGKNFYKSLISCSEKKRMTITAESFQNGRSGIGIMTVAEKINHQMLDEHYDTFMFHGFRVSTPDDTWYKICLRRRLIREANQLRPDLKLSDVLEDYREKQDENASELLNSYNVKLKIVEQRVLKTLSMYKGLNEKDLENKISSENKVLEFINSTQGSEKFDSKKCKEFNKDYELLDTELRISRQTGMSFLPEEIEKIRSGSSSNSSNLKNGSSEIATAAKNKDDIDELNRFFEDLLEDEENAMFVGCSVPGCKHGIDGGDKLKKVDECHKNPFFNMTRRFVKVQDGDKKMLKPSTNMDVEYYGKSLAIAIELYVAAHTEHPTCCLKYLQEAFLLYPRRLYCLISVPPHQEELPLLQYFHKLNAKKITFGFRDMYVSHRLGVTGTHLVREGQMADLEEILAMSYTFSHSKEIHLDVLSILLDENSPPSYMGGEIMPRKFNGTFGTEGDLARCFVLMASSMLVAFAVVERNKCLDYYIYRYNMEKHVNFQSNREDRHGYVRHLFMDPLFRHLTRFFLRGIMKLCDWTTLITSVIPDRYHHIFPRYSLVHGLEHWIPLRPRILPQYRNETVGALTPGHGKGWDVIDKPARALHLMTYRTSGQPKKLLTYYIVVVGVGDAALSFLEHLIFSPRNHHIGFKHITVISERGLPMKYAEPFDTAVKMTMVDTSGRYDNDYLDRLGFETWITSVYGFITYIDRHERTITVNGNNKIRYDYLFLFCGSQFLQPIFTVEVREKACITDNVYDAVKNSRELPINVFIVNYHLEAYLSFTNVTTSFKFLGKIKGSQVVVYGSSVQALACISGLLALGVKGDKITLVTNQQETGRHIEFIHSPEIKEAVLRNLKELKITVYEGYYFESWEEIDFYGSKFIRSIQFLSERDKLKINTVAVYWFHTKGIRHRTSVMFQSAGLAYDGKLIINTGFQTSCEDIYAGGSITKYSNIVKTDAFDHTYYNSVEIGAEIAYKFLERKLNQYNDDRNSRCCTPLITFTHPLVMNANLPGGWKYLKVTRPGKVDVLQSDRAFKGKLLQTGDPNNKDGPGYFQIFVDENGTLNDIICYTKSKIDVSNLINLYGKHECLLNNLLRKFEGKQILDFFAYFREPWAYAIYHDKFPILMKNLDSLVLRKLPYEDASFYNVVAHAFEAEKWQKISQYDKELLEDLFHYAPELKLEVGMQVQSFLENNQDVLTTYLTNKRMKNFNEEFENMTVIDSLKNQQGLKPLVEETPKHIVPEIRKRREMVDRPVKITQPALNLGSEEDSTPEDSSHVLSKASSEGNASRENKTYQLNSNNKMPIKEYSEDYELNVSNIHPLYDQFDFDSNNKEVEVKVAPVLKRNVSYINIPVEDIEFEEAIKKKLKEFNRCMNLEVRKTADE